jgi:hypothetical protein
MKTVFALLIVALTGCNANELSYYINDVPIYPEFEWVEPLIFEQNFEDCRRQPTCSVDQIFKR